MWAIQLHLPEELCGIEKEDAIVAVRLMLIVRMQVNVRLVLCKLCSRGRRCSILGTLRTLLDGGRMSA